MINNTTNPYVTLTYLLLCHTLVDHQSLSNTTDYNPFGQKQLVVSFKSFTNQLIPTKDEINKLMLLIASESLNFVRLYDSNSMIFKTEWNNEFCVENILNKLRFVDYVEEDISMHHCNFYHQPSMSVY